MEIPQKIGWKRLLLTGSEKFLLDLARLSPDTPQPDDVEKVIIFFEGLTPSAISFRLKRFAKKAIVNIYWHVMPKRLKVRKSSNPIIVEYLPWFKGGNKKVEQHLYRFGEKRKVLTASSGLGYNSENYTYSWKKAYKLCLQYKKEVEQERIQRKLDYELSQLKGEN